MEEDEILQDCPDEEAAWENTGQAYEQDVEACLRINEES